MDTLLTKPFETTHAAFSLEERLVCFVAGGEYICEHIGGEYAYGLTVYKFTSFFTTKKETFYYISGDLPSGELICWRVSDFSQQQDQLYAMDVLAYNWRDETLQTHCSLEVPNALSLALKTIEEHIETHCLSGAQTQDDFDNDVVQAVFDYKLWPWLFEPKPNS